MKNSSNLNEDKEYLVDSLEKIRTRLIDTTRRNRLLNHKYSARDIAIIDEQPNRVYEHLVQNGGFVYFDPLEQNITDELNLFTIEDPDSDSAPSSSARRGNSTKNRHRSNRLQTDSAKKDLARRLERLYQNHRTLIEETGANSLYLALGFLQWSDTNEGSPQLRSPLILLPVRLKKERIHGVAEYKLEFDDEALDTNYSLYEKLKHDFDITLPLLQEEELPETYFGRVENMIAHRTSDGWKLIREMAVGMFRFNKQVMWHDLDPKRWPEHSQIIDKHVLKRILLGSEEGKQAPGQLVDEYPQDDISEEGRTPQFSLIMDADSSQYTALVDAFSREDGLVIEGPPGTGKSQTITNLIATALEQGQSVLFVAEKMAALQVVYKRLEAAGLGDFCLQLHGLKTSKKELLQSVMDRINHKVTKPQELSHCKQNLNQSKKELIEVSQSMMELAGPEDLPLYKVMWRVECLRQALPENFQPIKIGNSGDIKFEAYQRAINLLNDLGREWSAIPQEACGAWRGFLPERYDESQNNSLTETITLVISAVERMTSWLEEHEARSIVPSLFEVMRLLKLAEFDTDSVLPPLPIGADLTLAHKLTQRDQLDAFKELLEVIDRYFTDVRSVNEIFDYASEHSSIFENKLRINVSALINVACNADITVGELTHEKHLLDELIDYFEALPEIVSPVTRLTEKFVRTLDDYKCLSELATVLTVGPSELSLYASSAHAKSSVRNYLTQANERFGVLVQEVESLNQFNLGHIPDTQLIRQANDALNKNKSGWLRIFNKEYRSAKALVKGLMRQPEVFSLKTDFLDKVVRLVEFCEKRDKFANDKDFNVALGPLFRGMDTDWKALENIIKFSQKLREQVGAENAYNILSDWDAHVETIANVQHKLNSAIAACDEYAGSHPFPKSLWQRPIGEVASTMRPWSEKLQIAVDEIVQPWCRSNATLKDIMMAVDLFRLAKDKELQVEQHPKFDTLLSEHWSRSSTNVDELQSLYGWIIECLNLDGVNLDLLHWVIPNPDTFRREHFTKLVAEARVFKSAVDVQMKKLNDWGTTVICDWIGGEGALLENFKDKLEQCIRTLSSIPLLMRWQLSYKNACASNLQILADTVSSGQLVGEECSKAFEYSILRQVLAQKVSLNPKLQTFGHAQFENLRARFAEIDKKILGLNAQHTASRLMQISIPEGIGYGPVRNYTEKRLLLREAGKQKGHIPIRKLIERSGNALQALKPCFLMSPISVAQYLAPGKIEFDLVVMDEASQIRPEDALGAIARSRKAVIVGDPNQLPPTSFFDTNVEEDEDTQETIVDDTDSILGVCLKQFPYRRLRWHYRSQHESLIQFSNEQFYKGDLIVFPSPKPDSREFGVHSTSVNEPTYSKGRNRAEARIVVENIIHHYRRYANKSLGVAAFNKRQAEEIQLLLEKVRNDDPCVDDLISQHEAHEPLFIKNLENVQGDERDVIFISTTYGPEAQGAPVFQRFGPINSELGWRRINVIATRARQRIEVFTSLKHTDIIIGGGASRGVLAFRNYLEYAASGKVSVHGKPSGGSYESEFEEAVAKILTDFGYECDPQVGVAGFYIDLGVRHPDRPGEYLIGIECDGAAYHSARSIRDRDRLRQEILENKGWHIHRIWSTSWYHTRAAEIDRLKFALSKRLDEDRTISASTDIREPEFDVIEPAHYAKVEVMASEEAEVRDSLEMTLERFWERNIRDQFPSRSNSILSEAMVKLLVAKRPETEEQWFHALPMELRQGMDPHQKEFLGDILDVIADYV